MKHFVYLLILVATQLPAVHANTLNRNCVSTFFLPSHDIDMTMHGFGNYRKAQDDSCQLVSGDGFLVIFNSKKSSDSILIESQINGQAYGPKNELLLFDSSLPYPPSVPAWADQFVRMYRSMFQKLVPQHLATYDRKLVEKQKAIEDEKARVAQEQADKLKKEEESKRARILVEIEQLRPEWLEMNPGQLFAKADEFAAREESLKAREVLRTLVRRFPEHSLAALAAQQLARMP